MQRRTFLTLVGTELALPAHCRLPARPAEDLAATTGSRVPPDTVEEIDAMTGALRQMDDQIGGATLLEAVNTHLRTVTGLLEHRTYDATTGRRLHSSAAELLRLAGWVSFDSGRHALARRYWRSALRTADACGDHAIAANVLGFMSCQAKDIDASGEAITLAESARAGYPGASHRVAAILHLRAAEAYAVSGVERTARAAIDDAFASLDQPITAPAPPWSYWCTTAHAHAQAGYCFLHLGHHDEARTHLSHALAAADNREKALQHSLLAASYLHPHASDPEQALAHANHALDLLTEHVDSPRCRTHLRTVVNAFAAHHSTPDVGDLVDRIRRLQ